MFKNKHIQLATTHYGKPSNMMILPSINR